jgi:two-component system, chemotaxis family, sensor kinase CheA
MSLDPEMAEIAKVFFAECREGLDAMEAGLLRLDQTDGGENIDTIFRAAHSIKGGAATFGFQEIAGFTHGIETLLDDMRNGTRAISAQGVQILLQSSDCLRDMVAAAEVDQPVDTARIKRLNAELESLQSADSVEAMPAAATTGTVNATVIGWNGGFEPVDDLFKLRTDPVALFQELTTGGNSIHARVNLLRVPALQDLDPEKCYLAWNIDVIGPTAEARVHEVFGWVDHRCGVAVAPLHSDSAASQPAPAVEAATTPSAAPKTISTAAIAATAANITPKAAADAGSIRVATDKVDNIINLVGELLITQSMLSGFSDGIDPGDLPRLRQALVQLARNSRELQDSVMQMRLLPISFAFNRFPRLVHDLSRSLGKKVELKFAGENTELDKTVLEKICDPLVHLVRNALDHGLETPARRTAAGKDPTGTLELGAFHEGGSIIIEVRDDGAGLNRQRILQRAQERGLIGPSQALSDEEIDNLIFLPGFSTAEQISDVSGRGVGMDVVRRNIADLGGHVQIFSSAGRGSRIRIRLPLTLAILDAQLVRVGLETYVISVLAIVETIQVRRELLSTIAGKAEVFRLRDEYLPVVKLFEQFGIEPDSRRAEDGLLVVVEADGTRVGLLVDDLLAQQQVVIKSLEANFKSVQGLAGATILGDGAIALIIDVQGLIQAAGQSVHARSAAKSRRIANEELTSYTTKFGPTTVAAA